MQEELPGMPAPLKRATRPKAPKAQEKPEWSGPIPGQTVMHPRRLGELSYGIDSQDAALGIDTPEARHMEVDPHGFVQQIHNDTRVGKQFQDLDVDARTVNLHSTYGGSVKTPMVREHWARQPRHEVRTDTPIHSTQWHGDTEAVGSIDDISRDLMNGGKINQPVWLVKDMGKLYALDGHHRITAARRAGHSHFPARIWDRDAETGGKR